MQIDQFSGVVEFLATARLGSFTSAGVSLGVTKSAVSKSVSRLEARLRVRLFHRTTRKLTLTAEGQAFERVCEKLLAEFESFEDEMGAGQVIPTGRVRLSLPSAYGRLFIVPHLVEMMRRYPELEVSAKFTDERVDLIESGIDVALRIGAPPDTTDIVAKKIGTQTLIICASPEYLRRHGTPRRLDDLASHQCIVGRRNVSRHAWLIRQEDGTTERFPVNGRYELEDGEAMLAAAKAGLGLAQIPTWLGHQAFETDALIPVLDGLSGGTVPIYAMWLQNHPTPLRVRVAVDALTASVESEATLAVSPLAHDPAPNSFQA